MMDSFLNYLVAHKNLIIGIWKIFYYLLVVMMVLGAYFVFTHNPLQFKFYDWGKNAGELSLILFGITIAPGILRRFGLVHKLISTIIVFRRYLGISVYLLALFHFSQMRLVGILAGQSSLTFLPFELMGLTALSILLFLFLTSNNWSQDKFGVWWKRMHRLVYIIVWLLFLHTFWQEISVWSIFIGIVAVLETISVIYNLIRRKTW